MDIEHSIDVLMRLVSRDVYNDGDFINELNAIIEDFQEDNEDVDEREIVKIISSIQDLHMFYKPTDQIVRTGDIVEIDLDGNKLRAVVITPACDLAIPKRTTQLRLTVIREPKNN